MDRLLRTERDGQTAEDGGRLLRTEGDGQTAEDGGRWTDC